VVWQGSARDRRPYADQCDTSGEIQPREAISACNRQERSRWRGGRCACATPGAFWLTLFRDSVGSQGGLCDPSSKSNAGGTPASSLRRRWAPTYIGAVERFAGHFGKPPDKLGKEDIREWQAHRLHKRKLAVGTVVAQTSRPAVLLRGHAETPFSTDSIPYPKYTHHRVPKVLSPEEVAQLIDAASNLQARASLMWLYSTGMRRSELVRLRVEDIDSKRMIVHIRQGKGGQDRDVPLCPRLLETLREYWRSKKPKTWLFPARSRKARRRPPDRQRGLVRLLRSRPPGGSQKTRRAAHAPPQFRYSSAGEWRRPADHPDPDGIVRSRGA
jgi:integrase/recombinase XerD